MASTGRHPESIPDTVLHIKGLINSHLKSILRSEGLAVSGVKSELQIRLIAHLEKLSNAGDFTGLDRVKRTVFSNRDGPWSSSLASNAQQTPPSSLSPSHPNPVPRPSYNSSYGMHPLPSFSTGRITFKESPFYAIVKPLSSLVECKARESTRDHVDVTVNLDTDTATKLQNDEQLRVMVFCAADGGAPAYAQSDIAFPHQVELKVNLDEVKVNLRGLKNRPGSTRPADITSFIRKKSGYSNKVTMTYALTQKKFFLIIYLVQKPPVEQLVERLKTGKLISKAQVLREMVAKAQDADIIATSTVMSLKCPISTLRIDAPCRSVGCTHNQCFDASSYLQLQEQGPTWTCPVCNKYSPFENLTIDEYVYDILKSTSRSVEQVTIEPGGAWSKIGASDPPRRRNGTYSPYHDDNDDEDDDDDDDDEDDLVEIQDNRVASLRQESHRGSSYARTPPMSSREESIASSAPRPHKRPAAEVVDLTLSDDDDAPPAKIKRPSVSGGGDSFRNFHDAVSFTLPRSASSNFNPDYYSTPL